MRARAAILDPPTRGERFAWCLFDFANSAFNTIVVTFVYANFFIDGLVGDRARGDVLWAWSLAVAGVVVALVSPVLGAMADRSGKRRYLIALAATTIVCIALLFFPTAGPDRGGGTGAVWAALCLFTAANISFELMFVFYNAFLPGLGDSRTIGRLSGHGWALGYLGGLACLVVCLGVVGVGEFGGWVAKENGLHMRATNLVVAAWFFTFGLPMFLFVRDRNVVGGPHRPLLATLREVGGTLRGLGQFPDLLRFLVAHLFYNDAVLALIGLAAVYMKGTLGMEVGETLLVAVWLNVAAGLGAFAFGYVDDRVGARAAVLASLVLLLSGGLLAILWPTVPAFWVAATLVGIGFGPNQSASRSLLARFIVPERSAGYYGLYALSGKATVWLGPLAFGLLRDAGADQRVALSPLILLLLLGLVLMLGVDERRGIARASQLPGPIGTGSGAVS